MSEASAQDASTPLLKVLDVAMSGNCGVMVERRGCVLVIAFDRQQRRNAIDRAASQGVADALVLLEQEPELRAGVLTGRGGVFSAGMDLKAFAAGERPELESGGLCGLVEGGSSKPLIAAVEGFALAGGCELALACDLIVAAEDAVFGLPEVSRGLVAGSGGLVRLPRRIPSAIALEYALTGERMDARTAHGWGLVNRLMPSGGALQGALGLAERIAANAPLAVAASKRIMAEAPTWPAAEVWARQRPLVDAVVGSRDALEGARAFAEKRPPVWSGA